MVGAVEEDSDATGVNGDPSNNAATNSGAAYLFEREGGIWSHTAYLKASNTDAGDFFGTAVAVTDAKVLVGARGEDSNATGVNGNQNDDSEVSSGAAYVFEFCSLAPVAFRNAGSNPASYTAMPAVIGTTFTASVDNNLAGQTTSLLFAFDTPFSLGLAGGQTLLCLDLGSGELFTGAALAPASSLPGIDHYSLAIPNEPLLCGLVLHTQAIQFGHATFVLSNAQDLTIGSF